MYKCNFTKELYEEKCVVCGEIATHICNDNVHGVINCGMPLCDNEECKKTHFKKYHEKETIYKCTKDFWLEEADDNGSITDGSWEKIKKGSLWKMDYTRNLCGGDIRLLKIDYDDSYEWVEISHHTFSLYFQIIE